MDVKKGNTTAFSYTPPSLPSIPAHPDRSPSTARRNPDTPTSLQLDLRPTLSRAPVANAPTHNADTPGTIPAYRSSSETQPPPLFPDLIADMPARANSWETVMRSSPPRIAWRAQAVLSPSPRLCGSVRWRRESAAWKCLSGRYRWGSASRGHRQSDSPAAHHPPAPALAPPHAACPYPDQTPEPL